MGSWQPHPSHRLFAKKLIPVGSPASLPPLWILRNVNALSGHCAFQQLVSNLPLGTRLSSHQLHWVPKGWQLLCRDRDHWCCLLASKKMTNNIMFLISPQLAIKTSGVTRGEWWPPVAGNQIQQWMTALENKALHIEHKMKPFVMTICVQWLCRTVRSMRWALS